MADPIIGLLITVAIFGIVWQSAKAVITRSLDGVDAGVTDEIRHAAEHVPGLARLVDVRARWLGHKLAADLTIAVDEHLSVADANQVAVALKAEFVEHLPLLQWTTVQFDTGDAVAAPAHRHHHAPEPFAVEGRLEEGELAIIDTPEGERMRLTLTRHVGGLTASVTIKRLG